MNKRYVKIIRLFHFNDVTITIKLANRDLAKKIVQFWIAYLIDGLVQISLKKFLISFYFFQRIYCF